MYARVKLMEKLKSVDVGGLYLFVHNKGTYVINVARKIHWQVS
jgi:hypothetical protein